MRVLITGGTGFTGRYMHAELSANGYEVTNLQCNLMDYVDLEAEVHRLQPNYVVHLAGIAFVAHQTPMDFYETHVLGTLNLLKALATKGGSDLRKVLLASSANVYGNSIAGQYTESTPLKPANDYAVSKLAMEYMSWLWREKLPIVIARPFNYTGVGQSDDFLLPKLVRHFKEKQPSIALGNTFVKRDFSDVRDVVYAYRGLLEASDSKGAVNVCSEHLYSVDDVLAILRDISGHNIQVTVNEQFVRRGEVPVLYGSCERLRQITGNYVPCPLRDTLQWMLDADGTLA